MKASSLMVLAAALVPGAVGAQQMQMSHGAGGMDAVRPLYEMSKSWIIKSAEQMPESDYGFKPTPEVRSFGQLIGHVANSQYEFCVPARGEASPNKTDWEKTTTKADLLKGLREAFAYCDGAFQMSDAKAMEPVDFFGSKRSRLYVLVFDVSHNSEHYGNLITYFRLKGMVPPSSQRGM